jgi:hypothetical protein
MPDEFEDNFRRRIEEVSSLAGDNVITAHLSKAGQCQWLIKRGH